MATASTMMMMVLMPMACSSRFSSKKEAFRPPSLACVVVRGFFLRRRIQEQVELGSIKQEKMLQKGIDSVLL